MQALRNAEGLMPLGSTLKLGVLRNGSVHEVRATLQAEKLDSVDGADLDPRLRGVRFSELEASMRGQGVAVSAVEPGSRAALSGLHSGDVVVAVGNQRIPSLNTLRGLARAQPRQLVLVVADEDGVRYVLIN